MLPLRTKGWSYRVGGRRSPVKAVALAALVAVVAAPAVTAQSNSPRDLPTIRPTYTRIFGSDTLEFYGPKLSPDERWILFEVAGSGEKMSLWLVSATGGQPIPLTDGNHMDDGAVWFPTSDRIAFRSDRQGHWAIMTLPIDPRTGRPTAAPRTVTLEGSSAYFDVSPDGNWIAYTPVEDGRRVIRIVPSNGGTARTLVAADTPRPIWSSDGRYLYYHLAGGKPPARWALMRIGVAGGTADTVMVAAAPPRLGHASLLLSEGRRSHAFDVATLAGGRRARFRLPRDMRPPGLTGLDAKNRLLTTVSSFGTALRILPVDGGPARQLTDGSQPDRPLGWTDQNEILFSTRLNGDEILMLGPAGGGEMRQVRLPEPRRTLPSTYVPAPFLSRDGSRLFYEAEASDPDLSVLKVFSLRDGTTQEITSAHPSDARVLGPGGIAHFNGADFVYLQRQNRGYELRAWTPERGSRRLRTFADLDSVGPIGVRGDRIAYAVRSADRATLRVTSVGEPTSREVLSVSGTLQSVSWSPDGRYLVMVQYDGLGAWESARVAFQEISQSGDPIGELRYVGERSLSWWDLRWLPNSRGVLAVGWDDANVWLFPVDPGERPACVTQDEPRSVWEYVPSPDGRHIVYPSRVPRGSSIWMVELGAIPGGAQ